MKSSSPILHAAVTVSLLMGARQGLAQEDAPPSLPTIDPASAPLDPIDDLQQQIDELKVELRRKEEQARENASKLSINGYADLGFFFPMGNDGAGWQRDRGNSQFPELQPLFAWTFVGDILSTAVNTRGEAADLGDTVGNISRFDGINSDGAGGFLVNEVNMRLGYQLARQALLRTSINFVPRSGIQDFSLGDSVDVDLAELEYVLTEDGKTSFFVGKTLPVFGIEYKERKSDQRFGVTPSLVHRYTSGPQLGAKLRSKLLWDWVVLAAAVSNNSSVTEPFHFHSEIDKNWGKTLSGRAALSIPVGDLVAALEGDVLELGASGLWGAQDRETDGDGKTKFWGFDLQYMSADFALKAQVMKGSSDGANTVTIDVWKLDLRWSGYVEIDWKIFSWLGVYGRAAQRDADVSLRADRIYVTKSRQLTGGLHIPFNPHVLLKLEYNKNLEYDRVSSFDNDIATSSLVLHF